MKGELCIPAGKTIATCFATDFFVPGADAWREEACAMIKARLDLDFLILTKRIDRFMNGLPKDWDNGYENVNLRCTVETQEAADYRIPLFLSFPSRRRFIARGPLLEGIDLRQYLSGVDHVTVGGETGREAHECHYDWVLDIHQQCMDAGKSLWFKETGSRFVKDRELIRVNIYKQHSMAKTLGIGIAFTEMQ